MAVLKEKPKQMSQMDEMAQHARAATELLKALAHESRLMILCMLVEGEKSVGELEQLMDLRQSNVSQQLARLRLDGLVIARRDGQSMYYAIKSEEAQLLIGLLNEMYCKKI